MTHVAVVGGGITGLAAAWELVGTGAAVTLVEAGERLGGRIRTEDVGGRPVDTGPDAFLARVPHAVQLCRELGLEHDLIHPAAEGASLWTDGRLRPLPKGLVMGAPTSVGDLVALVRAGLVTPAGAARAALDLVLPAPPLDEDPSVGRLVSTRLGRQVHERVVDPLVGGIHAGPCALLSARAAAPQLAEAAASRSLMRGLRSMRPSPVPAATPAVTPGPPPLFASLRGGLGRLVERLEDRLVEAGVVVERATPVGAVPVPGADATVLTVPAPAAAALLREGCPAAAAGLEAIRHASVALAVLVYPAGAVPLPRSGTGFLVPQSEGRLLTACSFGSSKWPQWAGAGDVVLRASAGRWGDERALGMGDDELVDRLHRELTLAIGLTERPRIARVRRWVAAFPQYRPGHLELVGRVETALVSALPGVVLAGAAYRGVGIAACIAQGRAAARRALEAAAAGG